MMIVIMMNMMCGVVTRSTMNNGATVLSTNLGGFRWNDIFWLLLAFFNSLSETVSLQPLHVVTDVIVFWRWQTLGQKIFWRSMFWFYYCLSPVLSLPLHAEVYNLDSNIHTGTQSWGISKWRSWKNDHRKKQYFYDIFLLASFICVRTVMLYATRISIVLSVFLQVLWKSEETSTFWGRTAQATSARTTMTTASTRKTVI